MIHDSTVRQRPTAVMAPLLRAVLTYRVARMRALLVIGALAYSLEA